MLPTLRQLEYVVAVADTGLFVDAARRCGVSQPALSKQVREVEELLGVVLFERVRPRVLVTDAGREVVERARRLLADARGLVEAARGHRAPRGRLKLGVIPTIAPYGLPGVLAELRRRYPDVAVVVEETQTEVLLERLRAGELDVGLLAQPFDARGLTGTDLVVEPFVLVAPEGHALGGRTAASAVDLEGASLILMEDGHCLRDQALDVCALAGAAPPTEVTAASVSTLMRMVEAGLGATLLPASALGIELRAGQGLVARAFTGVAPGRTVTLQWRASSPHGAWFRQVGEVLRQRYLALGRALPDVQGGPVPIRSAHPEETGEASTREPFHR